MLELVKDKCTLMFLFLFFFFKGNYLARRGQEEKDGGTRKNEEHKLGTGDALESLVGVPRGALG